MLVAGISEASLLFEGVGIPAVHVAGYANEGREGRGQDPARGVAPGAKARLRVTRPLCPLLGAGDWLPQEHLPPPRETAPWCRLSSVLLNLSIFCV